MVAEPCSSSKHRPSEQHGHSTLWKLSFRQSASVWQRESDDDSDPMAWPGCEVLLRDDLRLHDNPALLAGSRCAECTVLFVHDQHDPSPWPVCGAALLYKHWSLVAFERKLRASGGRLVVRSAAHYETELLTVVAEAGANCVPRRCS